MHIKAGKLKSLINVSISFFMAKAIGRKLCQFYKKGNVITKESQSPSYLYQAFHSGNKE